MNKPFVQSLTQRLYALSMSALITLAMVGSIGELFLGEDSAAQMAQMTHTAPAAHSVAPRA